MARLTLKTVNKAIAAKGFNAELVKSDGYFYFDGDDIWDKIGNTFSVYCYSLNQYTLEQWMAEFDDAMGLK